MATKEEIQGHIAKKLIGIYEEEFDGAYVRDAIVADINASDWNAIADWLHRRRFDLIGLHLSQKVRNKILADANAEAQTMVADDALSLAEYARSEKL